MRSNDLHLEKQLEYVMRRTETEIIKGLKRNSIAAGISFISALIFMGFGVLLSIATRNVDGLRDVIPGVLILFALGLIFVNRYSMSLQNYGLKKLNERLNGDGVAQHTPQRFGSIRPSRYGVDIDRFPGNTSSTRSGHEGIGVGDLRYNQ